MKPAAGEIRVRPAKTALTRFDTIARGSPRCHPSIPLESALLELDKPRPSSGMAAWLRRPPTPERVEAARIEFLGPEAGRLKAAQERLKTLEPAGKRVYGQRFNGVKQALEAALEAARSRLERRVVAAGAIDVTLPGIAPQAGPSPSADPDRRRADRPLRPVRLRVARGPEVEDIHHNFDALNIPPSPPRA